MLSLNSDDQKDGEKIHANDQEQLDSQHPWLITSTNRSKECYSNGKAERIENLDETIILISCDTMIQTEFEQGKERRVKEED